MLRSGLSCIEADVVSVCRLVRGNRNEVAGVIEVLVPQYRAKVETIQPLLEESAQTLSTALGSIKSGLVSTLEKEISREEQRISPRSE
jgi:hypothetical protein